MTESIVVFIAIFCAAMGWLTLHKEKKNDHILFSTKSRIDIPFFVVALILFTWLSISRYNREIEESYVRVEKHPSNIILVYYYPEQWKYGIWFDEEVEVNFDRNMGYKGE